MASSSTPAGRKATRWWKTPSPAKATCWRTPEPWSTARTRWSTAAGSTTSSATATTDPPFWQERTLWEILCCPTSLPSLCLIGGLVFHQGEGDAGQFTSQDDEGLSGLQASIAVALVDAGPVGVPAGRHGGVVQQ